MRKGNVLKFKVMIEIHFESPCCIMIVYVCVIFCWARSPEWGLLQTWLNAYLDAVRTPLMTGDNKGLCYDAVSISCSIVTSKRTCDPCHEAGQQTPNDRCTISEQWRSHLHCFRSLKTCHKLSEFADSFQVEGNHRLEQRSNRKLIFHISSPHF